MTYLCPACAADLKPVGFASPRNCAFTESGDFTPDNWNCATIAAMMSRVEGELLGDDETGEIIPVRTSKTETNGWIIMTRYKSRGCTSSAVHVGDFWPPRPVTYEMAAAFVRPRSEGEG